MRVGSALSVIVCGVNDETGSSGNEKGRRKTPDNQVGQSLWDWAAARVRKQ